MNPPNGRGEEGKDVVEQQEPREQDPTKAEHPLGGGIDVVDLILAHLPTETRGAISRALSTRDTARDIQAALIRSFCMTPGGPHILLRSTALVPGTEVIPGRCSLFRYKLLVSATVGDPPAPVRCCADRGIVLQCATVDGLYILRDVGGRFRADKEVVLAAMQNGLALYYADPELKKDREIVLAAVTQCGRALRCVGAELKKDREVVLAAFLQNILSLHDADPELRKDKEFRKIRKEALAARKREGAQQK